MWEIHPLLPIDIAIRGGHRLHFPSIPHAELGITYMTSRSTDSGGKPWAAAWAASAP
ncbi:MAG: hypothetical protein HY736_12945 [Verrucomicrobia bacterium]|nr:hypothetical protein [Verrucomicrobiota bacterium]